MLIQTLLSFLLIQATVESAQTAPRTLTPFEVRSPEAPGPVPVTWWGESPEPFTLPRGWTRLDADIVQDFGVRRAEDLAQFVPGAYNPHRFGLVTSPNIRGEAAEVFINGQRRSAHILGNRLSYHSFESIDLLRGPASVIHGPGQYTGGAIFLETRKPQLLEDPSTRIDFELGRWLPTESSLSWPETRLRLDHQLSLVEGRSGLRTGIEVRRNETLYRRQGGIDEGVDAYVAYRFLHEDRIDWNLHLQGFVEESPQLLGVNRPSQNLVSNGLYFTGRAVDAPFGPLPLDPGPEVSIPLDATLLSPADFGRAQGVFTQSLLKVSLENDWQFISRSFLESIQRRRFHAFEYREYTRQFTAEQKLELSRVSPEQFITIGTALRFERRESFANYYNEFPFAFDLTDGSTTRSALEEFPLSYIPGTPGPRGAQFFGPLDPLLVTPETTRSRLLQGSLFVSGERSLTSSISFNLGARWDGYLAEAEDPLDFLASDSTRTGAISGHARIVFQPRDGSLFFAGVNRSAAIFGNITGGGLNLTPTGNLSPSIIKGDSVLVEFGTRQFFGPEGDVFVELTVFRQDRTKTEVFGPSDIRVQGVESTLSWQMTPSIGVIINSAWTQGHYRNASPAELGGSRLGNVYAPGTGPEGSGTGLGQLGGFLEDSVPFGDWRIPGLSRWQVSPALRATWSSGWRGLLWGNWRSHQPGNLRQEYHFPSLFLLNASIAKEWTQWSAAVDLFNLTDERYFVHNGDTFFNNSLVGRGEPLSVRIRLGYEF